MSPTSDELVLLGVASDGTTDQWDGLKTVKGILLRWLQKPGAPFPPSGYDIWRAPVSPRGFPALDWGQLMAKINGLIRYDHGGKVTITSRMAMNVQAGALQVRPTDRISLSFPDPAWYVSISPPAQTQPSTPRTTSTAGSIRVELFADSTLRGVRTLAPKDSPMVFRTRGIDRVELSAPGAAGGVGRITYGFLHAVRQWVKVAHICLPVSQPGYMCGPNFSGPEEDQAKKRVPPDVDWAARYSAGFKDMLPYLVGLATGTPKSFPPSANDPQTSLDPQSAINLAALDPHIARVVGLAWDDTSVAMNGEEWAYQITGQGEGTHVDLRLSDDFMERWGHQYGIGISSNAVGRAWEHLSGERGLSLRTEPVNAKEAWMQIALPGGTYEVTVRLGDLAGHPIAWVAHDALNEDGIIGQGILTGAAGEIRSLELAAPSIGAIDFLWPDSANSSQWKSARTLIVLYIGPTFGPPGPTAILPSVIAKEPGRPPAPGWVTARPEQPGGTTQPLQAALEWDLQASEAGTYDEKAPVLFQVVGQQLTTNPTVAKPSPPIITPHDVFNAQRPILVPSATVASPDARRRYWTDKGLSEGWRCWWVRGIDLFGRVSSASKPVIEKLEDNALPPPPPLLLAEYVQAGMDAQQAAVLGRSPLAREWLAENPKDDAVIAAWGWTPELAQMAPDVSGFRVYVRRPAEVPNPGPNDPAESYADVSWGVARAEIGPIAVSFSGTPTNASPSIANVTVKSVRKLDETTAACSTDLFLGTGAGALTGANLVAGGKSYTIVGNGEGAGVTVTVEHLAGDPPAPGTYAVEATVGCEIMTIFTDIAPPQLPTKVIRRMTGVLLSGDARVLVLARSGGVFVCRHSTDGSVFNPGEVVTWYPAYAVVARDTGFGPNAGPKKPVAHAQVTVKAVRRWSGRQLESPVGFPGALTAVDITAPEIPTFDPIASGLHCAEVATRADWYGVSRVTLTWKASPDADYVVYRALGDAIFKLDREAHRNSAHSFAQSDWPPAIWGDRARRANVQGDLDALDKVLESGTEEEIAAAYASLRAGTQQLIAGQKVVRDAYAPRHGKPLVQGPFVDDLDGRSRAHWFYRLTARSRSGVESPMSVPTPPICCPDVVPPAAPLVQLALAAEGAVRLQWLPCPEPDLALYLVYRTDVEAKAADIRDMDLVARVVPSPAATASTGEVRPVAVKGRPWLEYPDVAPGGREWLYRIVALDDSGNPSRPSELLRGRSLVPRPVPPVWETAIRQGDRVTLSWTHPADQRLSCLIERRVTDGIWASATEWLPRGAYSFSELSPDPSAVWEYRLSVRDHLGQTAPSMPSIRVTGAVS